MPERHTTISLTSRVRRCDGVLSRRLDDEVLVLDLETEQYFGLGGVGSRIWEMLEEPSSLASLHASLLEEFDVPPEKLQHDLLEFVSAMRARRLVEVLDR